MQRTTPLPEQPDAVAAEPAPRAVSFGQAVRVWAMIGLLSFGGPAGQVALMHRELVERRRWIDEGRFLHALNYCMLLPGPEAQQLAIYIGWLLHRTRGGLVAGTLFVLPGFVAILGLSALYAGLRELPLVAALFFGLKAAVLAIVVEAVHRIGKRALRSRLLLGIAVSAFVAIFFFEAPFPLIVLGAGVLGFASKRFLPAAFPAHAKAAEGAPAATLVDRMALAGELDHVRPSAARAARVLVVCCVLWAAPLIAIAALLGTDSVWFEEGIFFSKTAMVTFGGAYAVLAYVAQRAVETYGWLAPGEMLDGLGLAETTPGPLILVLEFVGFLGASRHPGPFSPMLAGLLGACVTVWVTFVPCFLWIFLGAPYVESLRGKPRLDAALSAITAAVVGVIANLSVWFALHVMFRDVAEQRFGVARLLVPAPASIDVAAVLLASGAMLALLRYRIGVPKTLAASAVLGAAWQLLT